ncbi:hypothetical protein Ahy_A08g040577 [Arachis hypogaea]|uniref:Uncharacterized protein n=1 Tax=Arachis hypogaea TaxID=3818 RepID=A0A445BZM7_ARAHY|nr:hypothetical protein Ahy_A08g040577 [Arachis hypogaea]
MELAQSTISHVTMTPSPVLIKLGVGDKRTRTADILHGAPTDSTIDVNDRQQLPLSTTYNFHRTMLSKEQLFSKSQKVLSWSPILTKNSYGSEGSSYRRTGNREPPFLPDSLVLRMLVLRMSDCPSPTLTALLRTLRMLALRIQLMFYGRSSTPGCRRSPWGDLYIKLFAKGNLILFPRIPSKETLGEPPTPTTVHVRFLLNLINYPSYLLYVLDSPSLSQKSESPVQVEETIITAWTIRHPTRNHNDPIARTEFYQLSYNWSLVAEVDRVDYVGVVGVGSTEFPMTAQLYVFANLRVLTDRFTPNKNAYMQEITEVIKSMYDDMWPSYTQVPTDLKFVWDQKHSILIRKIFDHQAAKRLQQMMNNLYHWRMHLTSRGSWTTILLEMRALPSNKHRQPDFTEVVQSKSLNREATLAETFKYTHTLKANKERFVDK